MFKTLFWLVLSFSSDQKILEQGTASVPVSDLDAYVLLLSPESRPGFINDKMQIEKNIITMINLNIVNDYINQSNLDELDGFKMVPGLVEDSIQEMADQFDEESFQKIGLNKADAMEDIKEFMIKKENFIRMKSYLQIQLEEGAIDSFVKENFMLNKSGWVIPEKRDISLIKLDGTDYDAAAATEILTSILENDSMAYFSDMAVEHSSDSSVQLNQGHLKAYRENDLSYPFKSKIFAAQEQGTIASLFKHEGYYYLVRVNEIIPQIEPRLEDYKDEIKSNLMADLVDKKLQNIINEQAKNEVKINSEVMAHVFERYLPLIEE